MARAPALQAGGRGFEPHILHRADTKVPARFFDRMEEKADTKKQTTNEQITRAARARARAQARRDLLKSEKRVRAYGGCLGSRRRGRTRQAAKDRGEARAALDPRVSEWGNPPCGGTASA